MALVFEFRMPKMPRSRCGVLQRHTKLDRAATKRLMRHFHIVLPAKIGNNVAKPFQA
jgi:hypothetical protein